MPLFEKVRTIAKEIYRADDATADKSVKDQLKTWEEMGFGKLPVCIAKTQYSFSTNPDAKGAPTGFSIPVREVRLSAGAEFVVAICGEIMTMPGLPKVPSADFDRRRRRRQDRRAVLSVLPSPRVTAGEACKQAFARCGGCSCACHNSTCRYPASSSFHAMLRSRRSS